MALIDYLRTLKALIVEVDNLPQDFNDRHTFLKKTFPNLSSVEAEDFAKIPPDRFKLYTGTIFRGEANILKNRFPMTFNRLETIWLEIYNKNFNSFDFALELNRKCPWKSSITNDLAENLEHYFLNHKKDFIKTYPELFELIKFEKTWSEIKRAPAPAENEAKKENYKSEISFETIAKFTVEELLKQKLELLSDIVLFDVEFNLPNLKNYFLEKKSLPNQIIKSPTKFVVSRAKSLFPRITLLNHNLYQLLNNKSLKASNLELSELAMAFSEDLLIIKPTLNEEELFSKFLLKLSELLENRVIRIIRII